MGNRTFWSFVSAAALFVLFFFSKAIGGFFGEQGVKNFFAGERHGEIRAANAHVAKQLNAQTPIKLDEITTLTSVLALDEMLMYNHHLSITLEPTQFATFRERSRKALTQRVCANDDMKKIISLGGAYIYSYMDKAGFNVGSIELRGNACSIASAASP